jgi:hypothetical protein
LLGSNKVHFNFLRARSRRESTARRIRGIVAGVASLLLLSSVLAPAALADGPPEVPVIHLDESVSPAPPTALHPGDVATFTFNVECSSLTTECDNFAVTDTIPAPLVLGAVSSPGGVHSTISTSGNTFTVNIIQPLEDGQNGLDAGEQAGFTVTATVPTNVSASYDGQTVANPSTATASNVPTAATATASVLLAVPTTLAASVSKSYSPATLNSTPGLTTTAAIVASNTSNIGVTTLTVQDPANVAVSPSPFLYDGITGLSLPTWPGGANRVEVDWYDGTTWHNGAFVAAIALPTGIPASTIMGLRFTFEKTTGTVAAGAAGTIDIATALRSNVTTITSNTTVQNTASAFVTLSGASSTPVQASGNLAITHVVIDPIATKSYASASIVGGQSDEATVGGQNGGNYTLTKMVLTEPAAGDPDLSAQGLTFSSWDNANIEWPVGATAANIQYLFSGCTAGVDTPTLGTAQAMTNGSPMPLPNPTVCPDPTVLQTVDGFTVTFTGTMLTGQYATLPFVVGTSAVPVDVSETNTISNDVTTIDGQTAEAQASALLTLRTARINTTVSKTATPSSIYATTGAYTVISLPAQVDAQPTTPTDTGGSTVGADGLTVQDTAIPATDPFWNDFNPAAIVATDVPSNTSLTVNYWNATDAAWEPLDAATTGVVGPQSLTYVLTNSEEQNADGLQFVYTPITGTLPPGFSVQPNIKAVLRADLRNDPSTPPNATASEVDVVNSVESIATSALAVTSPVTDTATATVKLLPTTGGPGVTLISKTWATDPITGLKTVDARSSENRTAVINWGTGSQEFNSVVITDDGGDPTLSNVSASVFDAFNLVSIPRITSTMDPLLTYDEISGVELYIPGTGWVDEADDPCRSGGCDGSFPGYTLSAGESAAATGVQFTYIESPTRGFRAGSNPYAPSVGSGVAASTDLSRSIDLVFQIRNTKRSDPTAAVLGTSSTTTYNTGQAGLVSNTAEVDGYDGSPIPVATGRASDTIQILDQPVDVTATKTWLDGPLGVPPVGTPQSFYPTAYLNFSGKNVSVESVDQLSVADPTEGDTPFDDVNLTKIDSISIPSGSTATQGTVVLAPSNTSYTIAQALALTATDLANVTGITVTFTGPIAPNASIAVQVDTQLRATVRGSSDPVLPVGDTTFTIDNTTTASITDPEVLVQTAHSGSPTNVVSADATATMDVDAYSYGVAATKVISADTTSGGTPAIQYDGSSANATVTLSGQPTGNVPTTRMVIEDSSPSFWNAYNFNGFGGFSFATPINNVEVDVLVGITYDTTGGSITPLCNGIADLTDCWYDGTAGTTLALPAVSPAGPLPAGTTTADIRGIRFTFTKSDYSNWERPHNPLQAVSFSVTRRTDLVSPAGTPVASDLYTNTTPAPGETEVGVYTNTAQITVAAATGPTDTNPLWSATQDETAQIEYHHLPADVKIVKTPAGDWPLGEDIPYSIAVTNTGAGHDKILSGVVVTDTLPGDASGPYLVLPNDPDTGLPEATSLAFTYSMTDGAVTEPVPSVSDNEVVNSDGTETVTFGLTGAQTIPLGWTLTISTTLDFRQGLTAFTPVLNSATVTSDQPFDTCDYYTNGSETLPELSDVGACTSQTTTYPQPSAPLTIIKGVRGVGAGPLDPTTGDPIINPATGDAYDDMGVIKTATTSTSCATTNPALQVDGSGFYTYPCVPITRPGGTEEWANQFTNGGNINLAEIVAIDVLPRQGDTGVIINSARGSMWTPTLTSYPAIGNIPSGGTYQVEYTASTDVATARCNGADIQNTMGMTPTSDPAMLVAYQPCLTNTGAADDVPNRVWTTLPTSALAAGLSDSDYAKLLASVVALKFVVSMGDGLAPGGAIDITYDTQTANNIDLAETTANLGNDSIAYNSIAGAAIGSDPEELPYPFVSEPRKVGVALATGGIDLSKIDSGTAASIVKPASNNFTVSCKSNGVPVELFDSNGNARNPFTVTPGSTLLVQGIPLYSVCTVGEATAYGETVETVSPSTPIVAEAPHTQPTETVFNPEPAYDDAGGSHRPAIQQTTITNEYDESDFQVTKTINNGGALDGSGNPIVYKSPSFSASCTFNNGVSSIPTLATTTFTLASGGIKNFTSIPVGSVCTVKETNTQGAATDTYVLTANGTAQPSAAGPNSTFTIAANTGGPTPTNQVAFTNNYTTGSLEIDKVLAGDATWYTGRTFTFTATCTNTHTSLATDYSTTFSLSSPSSLTDTINNLPTGSVCTIVETGAAGATSTVVSGTGTIGNATTVKVTVTNTYSDATLTVTKQINSSAVDASNNPALANYAFPMSVTCTFQGAPVWGTGFSASPMAFTLQHGVSEVIAGLPAGASCIVTETNSEGADSTSVAVQSTSGSSTTPGTTGSLTLGKDGSTPANTVVITNNYGVTSFTVTKALAGGGAAQFAAASFTLQLTCSAPGIPVSYNGDITLPTSGGAWFKTISNLAENSVCSVVELGNRSTTGADTQTYLDSDGGTTGVGVPATVAEPGSVTVTNWYLTGSISVTKQVTGSGSEFGEGVGQFQFTLSCTRPNVSGVVTAVIIPGSGTRSVSDGDVITFDDIPSGSSCTLRESNAGGATSTAILDSTDFEVSNDATTVYAIPGVVTVNTSLLTDNQPQSSYTIRNTFTLVSLSVTKVVDSAAVDENGTAVSYGPFPVSIDCTFLGAAVYATGYSAMDPMQSDLTEGETWSLTGLVPGTSCDVTETDNKSATSTSIGVVTGTNPEITTPGTVVTGIVLQPPSGLGAANTATITNTYGSGTITVTKDVIGAGASDWGNGPFSISVECTLTDGSGPRTVWDQTYSISRGDPAIEIDHVASGAACTVMELKTGGATSTTIALDGGVASTETTADFTSPTDGDTYGVVVTNEFDETEVDVTKNRDGAGMDLYGNGPFEVSLVCTVDIDGTTTAVPIPGGATRTLDADDIYKASYTGLPAGSYCTPTETKTGGATSTVISPANFTTDTSEPTDLEITNTFTQGAISVAKTILGAGSMLYGSGPFETTIVCTQNIDGTIVPVDIPDGPTRELTSLNGYSAEYDQLPTGASCDVAESKTGGATSSTFTTASTGIIVQADATTPVDLSNEFDIGFITVDNLVIGNDAKRHYPDTYQVVLTCTEDVDGVQTPVVIPDGATRDIWHKTSITYSDLPIGATCDLVESVQNNAQTVTVTWHGMPVPLTSVTVGDPDFVIHVVNVYNVALGFTGEDITVQLLLGILALIVGLLVALVPYIRRRFREPRSE